MLNANIFITSASARCKFIIHGHNPQLKIKFPDSTIALYHSSCDRVLSFLSVPRAEYRTLALDGNFTQKLWFQKWNTFLWQLVYHLPHKFRVCSSSFIQSVRSVHFHCFNNFSTIAKLFYKIMYTEMIAVCCITRIKFLFCDGYPK